jgi:hypothetical protein
MTVAAYIQGGLIYRAGLSGGKYGIKQTQNIYSTTQMAAIHV